MEASEYIESTVKEARELCKEIDEALSSIRACLRHLDSKASVVRGLEEELKQRRRELGLDG